MVPKETPLINTFDRLVARLAHIEAALAGDQELRPYGSQFSGELLLGRPCRITKKYTSFECYEPNTCFVIRTAVNLGGWPAVQEVEVDGETYFRLQPNEAHERILRNALGDGVYNFVRDTIALTQVICERPLLCDEAGLSCDGSFGEDTTMREYVDGVLLKHEFKELVAFADYGAMILRMPSSRLGEALRLADRILTTYAGDVPEYYVVHTVPTEFAKVAGAVLREDRRSFMQLTHALSCNERAELDRLASKEHSFFFGVEQTLGVRFDRATATYHRR